MIVQDASRQNVESVQREYEDREDCAIKKFVGLLLAKVLAGKALGEI